MSRVEGSPSRRRRVAWLIACAAGAALTDRVHAAGRIYTAGTSNWNNSTNWFLLPTGGPGVPFSGDDAYLTQSDGVDRTVTFDGNYVSPASLSSLTIDASGTGTMVLSQAQNRFRADDEFVGDSARGTYRQSGGFNDAGTLYLGYGATGIGNYAMSNGATLTIASGLYVGYSGTGTMAQSAGAVSVTDGAELVVGTFGNSSGTYNLSGGTLATPGLRIADDAMASGQFFHSGGTATVNGDLEIASFGTSSVGAYAISGGRLTVAGNVLLGEVGTGSFVQNGGTVQVTGGGTNGLLIGCSPIAGTNPASIGTYQLSGTGQLSVAGRVYVGFAGNGTFTQTGGTANVNGRLVIASTTGTNTSAADFTLQGGSFTVGGEGVIQLNAGGSFTRTGGTLSFATFNMDGGTVNGVLTNPGTFNYTAGSFAGQLNNGPLASVNLAADFTAGNGMVNAAALSFGSNRTITLDGAGLNNTGSIQLQGSVLTGAGPFVNNGTLGGAGVIAGSGGFTNNASWNVGQGNYRLLNSGPLANFGTVTLAPSTAGVSLVLDAAGVRLENSGTINLNVAAAVAGAGTLLNKPTGIINAGGATIATAGFANQGTINVGFGGVGDLSVTPSFSNSGTIALATAGSVLTGGLISNGGVIAGVGQVNNPIDNAGTIGQSTAGVLNLAGSVRNLMAGTITAGAAGGTITANLADNGGTINVSPGATFSAGVFPSTGAINVGGTLDVDGIDNTGTITYAGAAAIDSFGPIKNRAGGSIGVSTSAAPSVTFYDDVSHVPGAAFTVSTGATATFLGNVSGNGNVTNDGAINLATGKTYQVGRLTGAGSTMLFEGATLSVTQIAQSALTLNSTGTTGASVFITPAASPGTLTNRLASLTVAGGPATSARLDLANTNLLLDYTGASPIATLRSLIRTGFNPGGPAWGGAGLTSSSAATAAGTALGYAEASSILGLSGNATADWFGQTADATSLLIRYTKSGDANLDGVVDFSDLVRLAQHYNDASGALTWYDGDFNYDGNVDFNDLVKLAQNYNTALAAGAIPGASIAFERDLAAVAALAPEPSASGLAAAGGIIAGLRLRRRRRCDDDGGASTRTTSR